MGNVTANSGYKPLAGDWDDDLLSSVGLYAPVTAGFFLRNEHLGGAADYQFNFGPANAGRLPLAGDWDGLMTSVYYATSGNGVGQLSQVRSPVGRKSTVAYDQFKRLDSIAAPHPSTAGATVDTELDSLQSVAAAQTSPKRNGPRRGRSVDEKDKVTEFETDRFGFSTLSIAPANPTIKPETRWTRDANGLATEMILPDPVSGAPSTTAIYSSTFDSQGNRLRATNPDGSHADWTYGPFSLVATADDERGGTTTFLRDAKGNVTSAADDLGNATTFEIDEVRGWVKSVTTADPDGTGGPLLPAKTDFLRDTFGNVTTLKRPLLPLQNESSRNTVVWTYDGSDNVTSSTDELGRRSDFLWDTLNRPVRTTGPDPDVPGSGQPAPVWRTQFNSVSEVVATWDPHLTDVLGTVTRANYNPAGLVSRIRLPDPATGKTTANSPTESFSYDAAGLPATAVDPLGRIVRQRRLH